MTTEELPTVDEARRAIRDAQRRLYGQDVLPPEPFVCIDGGGRVRNAPEILTGRDRWLAELQAGPVGDREPGDEDEPVKDSEGTQLTGREAWIRRNTVERS